MKYFILEPKWKKSVYEFDRYRKVADDGTAIYATRETCWRYGKWIVSVPETNKECDEYLENHSMDLEDYGGTYEELKESLMPSEDEETAFHEMDDYDHEFIETWDGCSEDWSVHVWGPGKDTIDVTILQEEIEERWEDANWDGMYDLDYTEDGFWIEINCPIVLTPCSQNGTPLEVNN